jgi:hypothetical protein
MRVPYCHSARVLVRDFVEPANLTCGMELVRCPGGCEPLDGGARCR